MVFPPTSIIKLVNAEIWEQALPLKMLQKSIDHCGFFPYCPVSQCFLHLSLDLHFPQLWECLQGPVVPPLMILSSLSCRWNLAMLNNTSKYPSKQGLLCYFAVYHISHSWCCFAVVVVVVVLLTFCFALFFIYCFVTRSALFSQAGLLVKFPVFLQKGRLGIFRMDAVKKPFQGG